MTTIKSLLKWVRDVPLFNIPVTELARWVNRIGTRATRWAVRHLPRRGLVRLTLPNGNTLVLLSDATDPIPNELFWRGWDGYEPQSTMTFFGLATRAATVVDVGAHSGLFSMLAAHANPAARVVAVEPFPATFARLEANVARNHLQNITCIRAAMGSAPDRRKLFFYESGLPFVASFSEQFVRARADSPNAIRHEVVEVRTLDELVSELGLGGLDLLKLDCEGFELEVLQGGRSSIQAWRPAILLEVLPDARSEELENVLRPLGYRFQLLTSDGPLEVPKLLPHLRCPNYLATAHGIP